MDVLVGEKKLHPFHLISVDAEDDIRPVHDGLHPREGLEVLADGIESIVKTGNDFRIRFYLPDERYVLTFGRGYVRHDPIVSPVVLGNHEDVPVEHPGPVEQARDFERMCPIMGCEFFGYEQSEFHFLPLHSHHRIIVTVGFLFVSLRSILSCSLQVAHI